jgi:hypothetical protein
MTEVSNSDKAGRYFFCFEAKKFSILVYQSKGSILMDEIG